VSVFNRAVTACYYDASLWQAFVDFVRDTVRDTALLLSVCSRGVRNCLWSGSLWASYVRALERAALESRVDAVVAEALAIKFYSVQDYVLVCLSRMQMPCPAARVAIIGARLRCCVSPPVTLSRVHVVMPRTRFCKPLRSFTAAPFERHSVVSAAVPRRRKWMPQWTVVEPQCWGASTAW
jgi:hypothetical protein